MDSRTHLIERAAARLETLGAPSSNTGAPVRETPKPSTPVRELDLRVIEPLPRPAVRGAEPEEEIAPRPRIGAAALHRAGLIPSNTADERVSEEFRIIQGNILRQSFGQTGAAVGTANNLVMVTSSVKGEGKSFCAINLAGEVARQGDRKVLLVETDPKRDGLADRLGASSERGLLDLARGKGTDLGSLTLTTETDCLDFLPFGTNGQGSAELFVSRRMAETIVEIGRNDPQRLVIFDAPPCLASSTPHTLASLVGQVVLIVAAGRTQRSDIEAALDLLQACPNVSLLLNKVPTWLAHSFGSYSYPVASN